MAGSRCLDRPGCLAELTRRNARVRLGLDALVFPPYTSVVLRVNRPRRRQKGRARAVVLDTSPGPRNAHGSATLHFMTRSDTRIPTSILLSVFMHIVERDER
jgi:hypothetical protein